MNNLIKDNKKNIELIRKDIEELSNKMMNNFKELKNNNNGNIMNYEYKTETYNNHDRYEGQFRNGKRERKGIYYFNNGNRYEGYFKNDIEKEKEYCILMVMNMKEILDMMKKKEKEYCII